MNTDIQLDDELIALRNELLASMNKKSVPEMMDENDDELEKLRRDALETKKSLAKVSPIENIQSTNNDKPRRFRYDRDTSEDESETDDENENEDEKLSLHDDNYESFDEAIKDSQILVTKESANNQRNSRSKSSRSLSRSSSISKNSSRSAKSESSKSLSPSPPARKKLQSVVTKPQYDSNNESRKRYRDDYDDYSSRYGKKRSYYRY